MLRQHGIPPLHDANKRLKTNELNAANIGLMSIIKTKKANHNLIG